MRLFQSVALAVTDIAAGTVVAALVGMYRLDWPNHQSAAWTTVCLIWVYVGAFGFSWVSALALSFVKKSPS